MASIYFYYNEVLRQSAQHASLRGLNAAEEGAEEVSQQQEDQPHGEKTEQATATTSRPKENQDEDSDTILKAQLSTEATLAALQPRMNRLAYLSNAAVTNLDALARSLGPKE